MIHTLYDRQPLNLDTNRHPSALDSIDASTGRLTPSFDSSESSSPQSAVVAPDHLIIFSGNMSVDHKDYVTNSLLFSDLAAVQLTRKIANLAERRKAWYKNKTHIMKGLGWAGFADSMRAHSASSRKFTMDQVGLEILANALAAAAVPGISTAVLLNLASDAVKSLRQSGEPLRLFQKESRTHQDGKFNIAVCMESPEGDVVLVSTNIYFIASHNVSNVLFWEWQSSDVDVASAGDKLVLNEERFRGGKKPLAKRLDDYMLDQILNLPLGD